MSKRPRRAELGSANTPMQSQLHAPSSAASSTRSLPTGVVPSLATLCARVFAAKFVELNNDDRVWTRVSSHLAGLPAPLVPKISTMLRSACPTFLHHEFIVTYLFRGVRVTLTNDLPAVKNHTILAIPRINSQVQVLELTSFPDILDKTFATVVRHLVQLRVLVLRGSTQVGAATVAAAAKSCPELRVLNVNYTSVQPTSVISLMISCRQLEVLKLAGIENWTDASFASAIAGVGEVPVLRSLRTLKLSQTSFSDRTLDLLLQHFPALERLDLSFTRVRHPASFLTAEMPVLRLQKLSLTSTAVSSADVVGILPVLTELRILSLGALGRSHGSRASASMAAALTMNDATLRNITDILERFEYLESVSLAGNTKLGSSASERTLCYFIEKVGRKLKKLNLAGITSLRSADLMHLVPIDGEPPSPLETVILNNTGTDDDAGAFLGSCRELASLCLAGTKMTRDGLFVILDSCPKIVNLDLTSCRGVKLAERRQFFEVWEAYNK